VDFYLLGGRVKAKVLLGLLFLRFFLQTINFYYSKRALADTIIARIKLSLMMDAQGNDIHESV